MAKKKKKQRQRIRHYDTYAKSKHERVEQRIKRIGSLTSDFKFDVFADVEKRLRRVIVEMSKHGKGDKRRGKKK